MPKNCLEDEFLVVGFGNQHSQKLKQSINATLAVLPVLASLDMVQDEFSILLNLNYLLTFILNFIGLVNLR